MIDFPSSPVDGQQVTSGRKTWQWVAATSTWDLVSTPDSYADEVALNAQAVADDRDAVALDRAATELARDIASGVASLYASTAAALADAGLLVGKYFAAISSDSNEVAAVYLKAAGPVATDTGKRFPTADAVLQPAWSGHKNAWLDPFLRTTPLAGNTTYLGKNRWYTSGNATLTHNTLVANPKFDGYAVQRAPDVGTTLPLVGPMFNLSDFGINGAAEGDTITCYALFTGDGGTIDWKGRFDNGAGVFVGSQVNPVSAAGGGTVAPNGTYLWLRHEQVVPATAQRFATWFYTNTAGKTPKLVAIWAFKGAASTGPLWPTDVDQGVLQQRVTNNETNITALQAAITGALVVPPYFYAVQGREANAYWDAFVPDDYRDYMMRMQPDTGSRGTIQDERWTYTPTGALTTGYNWVRLHDKRSGNELVTAVQMQIRAAASSYGSGLTKKIIAFGDSLTNAGTITQTMLDIAASDVMALQCLGTRGTGSNKHEGRGGWKWENYGTNFSDGTYGANPLWNSGSSAVDFANYLSVNSLAIPDWVFFQLGTNDCFSQSSDSAVESLFDTIATTYIDPIIASVKAAGASIKVALVLPPPPSYHQDSFGKDYGTAQWRGRYKRNVTIWNKKLIARYASQEANRIYLVPSNLALDTENNMATESVAVNSRNSTPVTRQANGVHPATSGYQQIGDAWWAFLKWFYAA